MKKNMTAIIVLALAAAALLFFFSSRSEPIDSLIHAPAQDAGNGQIWSALEKSVGGKYTLKTPTDGTHRSALVYTDLNADENDEVVVFYSPEAMKNSVCMLVLTNDGDSWTAAADVKSGFSEIKQVEFADFDGDGKSEIIVGWSLQKNNIIQRLNVYSFNEADGSLTQIFEKQYSCFGLFDFESDMRSRLAVVSTEMATEPVIQRLTLFTYSGGKFKSDSKIEIDPSITTVCALGFDVLKKGTAGRVYVDGYTSDGLLSTDLLTVDFEKSEMQRCYIGEETVCAISKRSVNVLCDDINDDKTVEIPTNKSTEQNSGSLPLIEWKSLSGNELVSVGYYYDNRENGYYFSVPKNIEVAFMPVLSADGKTLGFYLNASQKTRKDDSGLLFEIIADNSGSVSLLSTQYRYLDIHRGYNYYCRITEEGSRQGITKKLISSSIIFV